MQLKLQKEIIIRLARTDDLRAIQSLFVETTKSTCKKDYGDAQIKSWISSAKNHARWEEKLHKQYFLLAELDNEIIGFASLEGANYLDFMYVSKDHLRKGVEIINYKMRKQL